jgi:hypothetical protein
MLNNFHLQTGTTSGGYSAALPSATGVYSGLKRNEIGEHWAKNILIGAALITTLSQSSAPSMNWYANATSPFDPLSYSDFLAAKERTRVLTRAEQAVFHRALRRSAKIIHKAKRVTI